MLKESRHPNAVCSVSRRRKRLVLYLLFSMAYLWKIFQNLIIVLISNYAFHFNVRMVFRKDYIETRILHKVTCIASQMRFSVFSAEYRVTRDAQKPQRRIITKTTFWHLLASIYSSVICDVVIIQCEWKMYPYSLVFLRILQKPLYIFIRYISIHSVKLRIFTNL